MQLNSVLFLTRLLTFLTVLSLIVQASHYDAESGIYIGPSRKLSEDESILASLSLSDLDTGQARPERQASPLTVDPHSGIHCSRSCSDLFQTNLI